MPSQHQTLYNIRHQVNYYPRTILKNFRNTRYQAGINLDFFNLAKHHDHHGFLITPRTNKKFLCTAITGAVQAADYDKFMKGGANYTIEELK
jgi:hypothetical protein